MGDGNEPTGAEHRDDELMRTIFDICRTGAENLTRTPPAPTKPSAALTAAEMIVAAGKAQRDPVSDSDLYDEQPISLTLRMTLGDLRRFGREGGWRRIANAPKSRRVLLFSANEAIGGKWDKEADRFVADDGYSIDPTHWMPLPPPPVMP